MPRRCPKGLFCFVFSIQDTYDLRGIYKFTIQKAQKGLKGDIFVLLGLNCGTIPV